MNPIIEQIHNYLPPKQQIYKVIPTMTNREKFELMEELMRHMLITNSGLEALSEVGICSKCDMVDVIERWMSYKICRGCDMKFCRDCRKYCCYEPKKCFYCYMQDFYYCDDCKERIEGKWNMINVDGTIIYSCFLHVEYTREVDFNKDGDKYVHPLVNRKMGQYLQELSSEN